MCITVDKCGIVLNMNTMSLEEFGRLQTGTGRNKYHNKKTVHNGTTYDSKREAEYRKELDLLCNSGICDADRVEKIEEQVRYRLEVNGELVCTYVLDFRVTYGDGRVEHIDVKGVRTGVYKIKKKLMYAVHGIEILEV